MVNYVKDNPDMAAKFKSIDVENKTVNYGENCRVICDRKPSAQPLGWVEPIEPLQSPQKARL